MVTARRKRAAPCAGLELAVSAEQYVARFAFGIADPHAPLCVAYGMGVDSTAMLVAMWRAGVRPDLITFADTGDEKPETYAYLPVIQAWCAAVGFPPVVVVRYADYAKHTRYRTLYENCIANGTLPSLAFGGKGCSLKFKAAVQNAYRQRWQPARAAWAAGRTVTVCIGYDAGPKDGKRCAVQASPKYTYAYPLRRLGWDRDRCVAEIVAAGQPVPVKSACFYCPSTTVAELAALDDAHPELGDKIIAMEAGAASNLTAIDGLWRKGCKGTRGSIARPGSMSVFIRERRALRVLAT